MKKRKIPEPGKAAKWILRIDLPLLLLFAILFTVSYLSDREISVVYANSYYPDLMEYLFAGIAITVGSFAVADIAERERKNK